MGSMSAVQLNSKYGGWFLCVEYQGNRYTTVWNKHQFWTNSNGVVCLDVLFRNSALPFEQCKVIGVKS